MTTSKPVTDWATDWTHFDLRWVEDPFPIWEDLRSRCPIAHSMRFEDGAFFPSTYEYVREIAYDSDHFSSRRVIVREKKVELQPNPPITSDRLNTQLRENFFFQLLLRKLFSVLRQERAKCALIFLITLAGSSLVVPRSNMLSTFLCL